MTIRAYFENNGEMTPFPPQPTAEQQAFMLLTMGVGMPRLDEKTMPEFVRRIELYQTYIGSFMQDKDGPVDMTKDILREMLDGYDAAWTNANRMNRREFGAFIEKERVAFERAAARRRQAAAR